MTSPVPILLLLGLTSLPAGAQEADDASRPPRAPTPSTASDAGTTTVPVAEPTPAAPLPADPTGPAPDPTVDTGTPSFEPATGDAAGGPVSPTGSGGETAATDASAPSEPGSSPPLDGVSEALVAEEPPAALLRPPDLPLVAEDPPEAIARPPDGPLTADEPPAALARPAEDATSPSTRIEEPAGDPGVPPGDSGDDAIDPVGSPGDLSTLDRWLPSLVGHGGSAGMLRFVLAGLALIVAALSRRGLGRLPDRGLLPLVLRAADAVCRLLALGLILAGLAALLPAGLLPVVTWVLVAAALAAGWSAREVIADGVAGVIIQGERGLQVGHRVVVAHVGESEGFTGTVEHLGLRSTRLRAPSGQQVTVPNRRLTSAVLTSEPPGRVSVTTVLALPPHLPADAVRAALREAAIAAPWIVAGTRVEIGRDGLRSDRWTLTVNLIEGRFESRFVGTLHERVALALAARGLAMDAPPPGRGAQP